LAATRGCILEPASIWQPPQQGDITNTFSHHRYRQSKITFIDKIGSHQVSSYSHQGLLGWSHEKSAWTRQYLIPTKQAKQVWSSPFLLPTSESFIVTPFLSSTRRAAHPSPLMPRSPTIWTPWAPLPVTPLQNLAISVHLLHWWACPCDPLNPLSPFCISSEPLTARSPGDWNAHSPCTPRPPSVCSWAEEEDVLLVLWLDP
jgi:hypothetical protein